MRGAGLGQQHDAAGMSERQSGKRLGGIIPRDSPSASIRKSADGVAPQLPSIMSARSCLPHRPAMIRIINLSLMFLAFHAGFIAAALAAYAL